MPLTQQQLDARRAWMGATDVARVMTGRAADVWAEKVYGTVAEVLPVNDPRSVGSRLEQPVLDWAEGELGTLLRHYDARLETAAVPLVAACDAVTEVGMVPVEAKTSGLLNSNMLTEWGEAGTDEVPDYYLFQVTAQMICTGSKLAHIAALLAGRGFQLFRVEYNDGLADAIMRRAGEFWSLVQSKVVPDESWGGGPSMDTLKAIQRQSGKRIVLPDAIAKVAAVYDQARDIRLGLEKGEDAAKALLVAALGDAETGVLPDGRIVEVKRVARAAYAVSEGESVRVTVRQPKRKELE